MTSRSSLPCLVMLAGLCAAPGAFGYRVVTQDGRVVETAVLSFSDGRALLATDEGTVQVLPSEIDYYETFRGNVGGDSGNVIAFRTGSLFRFETIEFRDGTVRIGLGEDNAFSVPEGLVDFETSVLEGAMVRLPAGAGPRVGTSRVDSSDVGSARAPAPMASDFGARRAARADRRELSRTDRLASRGAASRGLARRASRTGEADDGGDATSGDSELEDRGSEGGGNDGTTDSWRDESNDDDSGWREDGGDGGADGGSLRDDGEDVPTGTFTLALVSEDSRPISALQVAVAYPAGLTLVSPGRGAGSFEGFASAMQVAVNPGSGGGQPVHLGGFLATTDATVTGPGVFARLVFQWRGEEADAAGVHVVSTTAVDELGTQLSDYEVTLSAP